MNFEKLYAAIAIIIVIVLAMAGLFMFPDGLTSVQPLIAPVITNPMTWYLAGTMVAVLFGLMICRETVALIDQIAGWNKSRRRGKKQN